MCLENPYLHINMYYTISYYYNTSETQKHEIERLLLLFCLRRQIVLLRSSVKRP